MEGAGALPDVQVLAPGTSAAPLTYTVPGSQEILIKALSASFDGSGAAGSFVPAVRIIAPGGKPAGVFIANGTVSAGDSVYASWAPFLAGAGPNGIQFDTDNRGGTLRVTTTGQDGVTGDGQRYVTEGGGGYDVVSSGSMTLVSQSGAQTIWNQDDTSTQTIQSDGPLALTSGSNKLLGIAAGPDGEIHITTTGLGTQIYTSSDGFVWVSGHVGGSENIFVFHLTANDNFVIRDSSNNLIFAVDEAGPTYHIKTGGVWAADL